MLSTPQQRAARASRPLQPCRQPTVTAYSEVKKFFVPVKDKKTGKETKIPVSQPRTDVTVSYGRTEVVFSSYAHQGRCRWKDSRQKVSYEYLEPVARELSRLTGKPLAECIAMLALPAS